MIYWQSIFNRAANKNDEDLIEDAKCIGFMEKIDEETQGKNTKGKEIKTFTYKFSKQDFKVKEKDSVIDATDGDLKTYSVGKVIGIDENKKDENIIVISSTKDLPEILSITKDEFVSSQKIIEAIQRFVKSAVNGEKNIKQL